LLVFRTFLVWAKIRDDKDKSIDWVLVGYDGNSKTDMTVVDQGSGGMEEVSSKLPEGEPVFGGVRLSSGRFVHFLYVDESCPAMKRGRTLMYKNGRLKNVEATLHASILWGMNARVAVFWYRTSSPL
jgi:hypothetical protein